MKRKLEEEEENFQKKLKTTFQFEGQVNRLENEEEHEIKLILNYFLEYNFEFTEFEAEILEGRIKPILNHKNEYIQILALKLMGKIYLILEPNFDLLMEKLTTNLTIQALEILIYLINEHSKTPSKQQKEELFNLLKEFLFNWDQQIRKSSLELLAYISIEDLNQEEISIILLQSIDDRDPRVRESALKGLYYLYSNKLRLKENFLTKIMDENVKIQGLELLCLISNLNSSFIFKNQKLVDVIFSNSCILIRDVSFKVRTKACTILGDLEEISQNLLFEAFQKMTLVSNEESQEGDEKTIKNELILEKNIIGSFLLGLEDEFSLVRIAMISSISKICKKSTDLFSIGIHFIMDMFSDEIDEVRKFAIDSVCIIGEIYKISKEELETSMSILKDFSPYIRHSIHHLFSFIIVPNIECLSILIGELFSNLLRYPQDKFNIFKSLKNLGQKHSDMAEFLIEKILNLNQFLINPEPMIDDLYVSKLIFLFNSSEKNQKIINLLPNFCLNHFEFLKNQMPNLFPNFSLFNLKNMKLLKSTQIKQDENLEIEYFKNLKENFTLFSKLIKPFQFFTKKIPTTTMPLKNIKEMISRITKELHLNLNQNFKIQLFKYLFELLNLFLDLIQFKKVSKKILNLTFEIEIKFKLNPEILSFFQILRFISLMFNHYPNIQQEMLRKNFQKIKKFRRENQLNELSNDLKLFTFDELNQFLKEFNFDFIFDSVDHFEQDDVNFEKLDCKIITQSNLQPIIYHSFIPYKLSIDAIIQHLNVDKKSLRILVKFTDNTRNFYPIEFQDDFLNGEFNLNLESSWNSPAHLTISIVSILSKENEIFEDFEVLNDLNFVTISEEDLKILIHPISN
eukprot:gene2803-4211_t